MSARLCSIGLLLLLVSLCGCTPRRAPDAVTTPPNPSSPLPPAESDEEKSLKQAVRSFHEELASGDTHRQRIAVTKILCTEKDIHRLFPKHEQFWGVLQFPLLEMEGDLAKMGVAAARRDKIASIELIDLRTQPPTASHRTMVSRIAPGIPAYRAILVHANEKVRFDPLFYIDGRWVWFPNLEQLTAVLPAAAGS